VTSGAWRVLDGPAGPLHCYAVGASPGSPPGNCVLVCHELPRGRGGAAEVGRTLPALADRLAQESGWAVVCPTLRGCGGSAGDFSATGWLEDLGYMLDHEAGAPGGTCVAGFGLGGALCLRLAARHVGVAGVAVLGTPDDLAPWVRVPDAFLAACRETGVLRGRRTAAQVQSWAADLVSLRPLEAAAALGGRPLLVVHGTEDAEVPLSAAHALVAAGPPGTEVRVVPGAGHWLRADPRVVASLIGWVERRR
jgi:putative redox protein